MVSADLRIAALVLVALLAIFYSIQPQWLETNRILASLPIQRFKWKSETFLSSGLNRTTSLISASLAFSIFIYSHYSQEELFLQTSLDTGFIQLLVIVILLFLFKLLGMKLFFGLHQEERTGTIVIDYQYAFNVIISVLLCLVICIDVFFFRLSSPFYITVSIVIGLIYLLRMFGNIILLLNEFNYPIVSLFIYLCAFEILPMLGIAKVLFVNS